MIDGYGPLKYKDGNITKQKDFINDEYFFAKEFLLGDDPDRVNVHSFGDLLKSTRDDVFITTTTLSKAADVSQSYISQLENEVRLPSDKVINKLSNALAVKALSVLENDYIEHTFESLPSDVYDFNLEKLRNQYVDLFMKSKEIHSNKPKIKTKDDIDLSADEIEIVNLFRSFNDSKKKQAKTYLKFLKGN